VQPAWTQEIKKAAASGQGGMTNTQVLDCLDDVNNTQELLTSKDTSSKTSKQRQVLTLKCRNKATRKDKLRKMIQTNSTVTAGASQTWM
jgi:hypothetical protein